MTFPVIERPTHKNALKAITRLSDLVSDFPFKKPEHRSAWLAFLLTPLARFAFDGPAPLFLVDANVRGSGKTLLCDLVGLIVTGREMPRMNNPENDSEARKRITAVAVNGDSLCLIDNVKGYLGCPSLDAALTATSWKDRLLGKTEIVEFPLKATWCATGNNVVLKADTSRRVCHSRLESTLENPEQRDGFAHENLKAYVLQNRSKLLADALNVLAAYCLAGRPKQALPPWGSFEGWSDLVRQAIVWCGHPDPGATRTELVNSSDSEAIALRDIIEGWSELDPDHFGLTSSEIIAKLEQNLTQHERIRGAFLELCPTKDARQLPSAGSLGKKLGQLKGRVVSGQFIDKRLNRKKSSAWFVDRQTAGDAGDKFHSPTHGNEGNTYRKEHETSPAAPASPAKSPDEQLEF
ncbi:MAG: hypothetical protein NT013_20810 [Planctomycetia bacterium]|nr:hypothetical protein [Planctomycetia bacterium]